MLEKIGYNDCDPTFNMKLHPVSMAMELKNYQVLDILGKFLLKNSCFSVDSGTFFEALECPGEIFKEAIIKRFFSPIDIQTDEEIPGSL